MTKREQTEQELSDMGIHVISCPFLHRKAIATSDGFVGIGKTADSKEARTILEHEKQHFLQNAFYSADTDVFSKMRKEARVQKALILELCPKENLRILLANGFNTHEVAEELEITEELVCEAFAFYEMFDPDFFRAQEIYNSI